MATAQINARIDSQVKSAGDRAFFSIGYTPTKVIRALWGFAARNGGNDTALRNMLRQLEGAADDGARESEHARRVRLAQEGPAQLDAMLEEMGFEPGSLDANISEAELRELAFAEKYGEQAL